MAAADSSAAAAGDLPDFPMVGISMAGIDAFIRDCCGGLDAVKDLATWEVCNHFVKPATAASKQSWCDFKPETSAHPTAFISHAWGSKFLATVSAMREISDCPPDGLARDGTVWFWFDLFSNSQHDTDLRPHEWWATTFRGAIETIGTTVLVLEPWDDPKPLKRAWCLWEIFCASDAPDVTLRVAMPPSEQEGFQQALETDPTSLYRLLTSVDVASAQAQVEHDRQMIMDAVQESPGGFGAVNCTVFDALWAWMGRTADAAVRARRSSARECVSGSGPEYTSRVLSAASAAAARGRLLFLRGRLEESVACLYEARGSLDAMEPGPDRDGRLSLALRFLGAALSQQRLFEAAADVLREAFELSTAHGDEVGALDAEHKLAVVRLRQRNYAEAEPALRRIKARRAELLGPGHRDTLWAYSNHAVVLQGDGQAGGDAHEAAAREVLELRTRYLGPRDPDTAISRNNYAVILVHRGRSREAEALLALVLKQRREMLGDAHPDTLRGATNIMGIRVSLGDSSGALSASDFVLERLARRQDDSDLCGCDPVELCAVLSERLTCAHKLAWESGDERRRAALGDHADALLRVLAATQDELLADCGPGAAGALLAADFAARSLAVHRSVLLAVHKSDEAAEDDSTGPLGSASSAGSQSRWALSRAGTSEAPGTPSASQRLLGQSWSDAAANDGTGKPPGVADELEAALAKASRLSQQACERAAFAAVTALEAGDLRACQWLSTQAARRALPSWVGAQVGVALGWALLLQGCRAAAAGVWSSLDGGDAPVHVKVHLRLGRAIGLGWDERSTAEALEALREFLPGAGTNRILMGWATRAAAFMGKADPDSVRSGEWGAGVACDDPTLLAQLGELVRLRPNATRVH